MRVFRMTQMIFLLLASSLVFGFQTRRFSNEGSEYELDLPSPAWRVISRLDVHEHLEFINGSDPANGYLHLRKIVADQPLTASGLFDQEEKFELKRLPGYMVCNDCKGESFTGKLSGAVFSYDYVRGGKTIYGRIYYLQVDKHTFYSLRFTVARDKLSQVSDQMDFIARSFRLK